MLVCQIDVELVASNLQLSQDCNPDVFQPQPEAFGLVTL